MTWPRARCDINDQRDWDDSAEAIDANEPIENSEQTGNARSDTQSAGVSFAVSAAPFWR